MALSQVRHVLVPPLVFWVPNGHSGRGALAPALRWARARPGPAPRTAQRRAAAAWHLRMCAFKED